MTSRSKTLLTANCSLAVQQPLKRNETGCSNGSSYIRRFHNVPDQEILSTLQMSRAIRSKRKKAIVISSKGSQELSVPRQSPTFRTARRLNPLTKHKTLFVKKKNHQPFELVQAVPKTLLSLLLSYFAEVCFRVHQTLS